MKSILILFLLFPFLATGKTIYVGSGHEFSTPNALFTAGIVADNDTILIEGEEYKGEECLAVWQANNIVIKGINGRPKLEANGSYILGKGIWVIAGNDTTVENIEFTGAIVPDHNGAGIRLDNGSLTVRNCYFHHNETGILTNNVDGEILVEYCEFGYNGYGDGFSHNIYVNVASKFTFQYNYSHHSIIGHTLKSRAKENVILYNYFTDGEDGISSRLIDLPNGGLTFVQGNILEQGPMAENNNFIAYGLEGYFNAAFNRLYLSHNTFINRKTANGLFIHIADGSEHIQVTNNAFLGVGELVDGVLSKTEGNYMSESIAEAQLTASDDKLYEPKADSPLIDGSIDQEDTFGYSLLPTQSYAHPTNVTERITVGKHDIGAYEANFVDANFETESKDVSIFPNPASDYVMVESKSLIERIDIYALNGKLVKSFYETQVLHIADLESGSYFVITWLKAKKPARLIITKL